MLSDIQIRAAKPVKPIRPLNAPGRLCR